MSVCITLIQTDFIGICIYVRCNGQFLGITCVYAWYHYNILWIFLLFLISGVRYQHPSSMIYIISQIYNYKEVLSFMKILLKLTLEHILKRGELSFIQ